MQLDERATALLDVHRELGAKLTEFGGWQMPLQYAGIVSEHNAVRNACGVFDVSHLGKLRLTGPRAEEALQVAVTANVSALEPGRATYALVLTDSAGVVDDVFVYRIAAEEWLIVPNAANVAAVAAAMQEAGGDPVDEWDRWSILALQGPTSFDVFTNVFPASGAPSLALHAWEPLDVWGRGEGLVARTGYTGERGFEMYVPTAAAVEVFHALLDKGAVPVGLGARDTLRLEMGYALYGHELTLDTNPLEAGLGWAVAWDTPFRGRDALLAVKESGPRRRLFGVKLRDKGVPRQGYDVYLRDRAIGTIVSGNFSPTLGTGIALAFGAADDMPPKGAEVEVEARGRRMRGDIVKPPFIQRRRKAT